LSPCFFSHESGRHNLGPDVPFSYPHSNSHIIWSYHPYSIPVLSWFSHI
jgi:hypothetical protein